MKIVIDISEEQYELISNKIKSIRSEITHSGYSSKELVPAGWVVIADGQVLPKGHGDLIDRKALEGTFDHLSSDEYESPLWYEDTVFRVIANAPTVIEADKEAENE